MPTHPEPNGTQSATFSIQCADWKLEAQVNVPSGPTRIGELLPLARALSDAVVAETSKVVVQGGEAISCKKGCGACCRMMVSVAEPEARRLRTVVEAMPEPRRTEVKARFEAALARLDAAGLLPRLQRRAELTDPEHRALSQAYFDQQIACPFLEDEACSIYAERPLACREYLVTSPATYCAQPSDNIRRIRMPLRVFNAVARWQVPPLEHVLERWVPLTVALQWAEANPNDPPPRPGIELLGELLDHLTGKKRAETEP